MKLDLFLDEVFAVLAAAGIDLNVPTDGPGVRGSVPAPYVELPEIEYGSGGPGLDRIPDLALTVTFGPANSADVFTMALQYASTTGPLSVRAALHAHTWVNAGTVFVRRAEPVLESDRGVPLIMYVFHIDVTGAP